MKKLLIIIGLCLVTSPALAQNSLLPTLQQVRGEFPQDWSHEDRGMFLNKVAWIHRAEGWGLLHKPGGNKCPTQQHVDVSCDYLVYKPTMQGFDVLSNETVPVWQLGDSFITQPERWIPPVAAEIVPPDAPGPVPTQPTELLQRVITIEQVVADIRQQNMEHEILDAAERVKAQEFRDAVGSEWAKFGKFVAKYGPIVLGAVAAGKWWGN